MRKSLCSLFCTLTLGCASSAGQAIAVSPTYSVSRVANYAKLNYENDFFTATDRYYTQGISIELAMSALKHSPLNYLLIEPFKGKPIHGLALEHNGYTPASISSEHILTGDRPFAATLMVHSFIKSSNKSDKKIFTTDLALGVLGQAAGGAEMQTGIHRALHNITPQGWQFQIHNDLIANYLCRYEQQILKIDRFFEIWAEGSLRAGTLSDKGTIGINAMLGLLNGKNRDRENLNLYMYNHCEAAAVGYDATLEGGVFNRTSPYTVAANALCRGTLTNRTGLVFHYKGLLLEYFKTFQTREFATVMPHAWGGIGLGYIPQ